MRPERGHNAYVREPWLDRFTLMSRKSGGEAPWPALGVAGRAVIRREDGRTLLLRRSPGVATDPGLWELPGGKMSYGEPLREAVAREVEEETGLHVRVGAPIHLCHFVKEPFWVTCVTFVCSYEGGRVRLSEENDDFAWIEVSEIPGRDYARTIEEQLEAYAAFSRGGAAGTSG